MSDRAKRLMEAIGCAKAGEWDAAHTIALALEGDGNADWLHAILHKIEDDAANSRYWYARTQHTYDDYAEAHTEVDAVSRVLGNIEQ